MKNHATGPTTNQSLRCPGGLRRGDSQRDPAPSYAARLRTSRIDPKATEEDNPSPKKKETSEGRPSWSLSKCWGASGLGKGGKQNSFSKIPGVSREYVPKGNKEKTSTSEKKVWFTGSKKKVGLRGETAGGGRQRRGGRFPDPETGGLQEGNQTLLNHIGRAVAKALGDKKRREKRKKTSTNLSSSWLSTGGSGKESGVW